MSKITQALEKAARERLVRERLGETTVVTAPAAEEPAPQHPEVASKVDPHIVTFYSRRGVIAEQYRMLRASLQALKTGPGARSLLITSAVRGEGKTVTALNLALTLAQQPDCRVLLIDADLRKGAVKRWLGLEARHGLAEILSNGANPAEALVRLESTNLTILTAGQETEEPSEWLASAKMRTLIQQFKQQFDYVLLDSPPLLLVADPNVLSRYVDGVLLVVRAGWTQRRQLVEAQERIKQANARLIGSVLTHVEYYNPLYYRYRRDYEQDAPQDAVKVPLSVS